MEKLLTESQVAELTGLAIQTLRNHRFNRVGLTRTPLKRMHRSNES
jgi:hypothetical protein